MIENRAIALGRGWVPWAVTLVGVMGLLVEQPPVAGQPNPPQQSAQSAELAEASRLNQQVEQLLKENQYSAAIPLAAAVPLAERAIAIREKVLGSKHPDVATSLNNLAQLYYYQGNDKQAEPLYQRALAIREKVLGPEHPDVAHSLYKLALLYWASGDIARAIEFLTRGTNIIEHNLAINLTTGSEAQKRAYIATLSVEPLPALKATGIQARSWA